MKKKDRNMFYSNYQTGGYNTPNPMVQPQMMPNGYALNSNYMSYGPNSAALEYQDTEYDEYDARITKLEKQIRKLEARISKLETNDAEISNDTYII